MTNAEARFNKSHIRKVYACLAVTCHLHFWQNDRDLLCATVVTRRWNGYRNKSQHRKSTLEKKLSRRSSRDSNPRPFNHESSALTTELSLPLRMMHHHIKFIWSEILSGQTFTAAPNLHCDFDLEYSKATFLQDALTNQAYEHALSNQVGQKKISSSEHVIASHFIVWTQTQLL